MHINAGHTELVLICDHILIDLVSLLNFGRFELDSNNYSEISMWCAKDKLNQA